MSDQFDSKQIDAAFSKAAHQYDENAKLQHVVREECITMACEAWGPGSKVLDLGSGTGSLSAENQQQGLNWDITQLDLSLGMCRESQNHNPNVVNASAHQLPFADASFDGVFSSLMLQWVSDPLPVFKELSRVLRPHGSCIISTFAEGTLSELRESFATLDDAAHVNRFANPASLTALAVHSGFKLLACEEETFVSGHDSVAGLMRALKSIGANTKGGATRKGMMTPSQLAKLEQTYRTSFASKKKNKNNELPATWQLLYMWLERT